MPERNCAITFFVSKEELDAIEDKQWNMYGFFSRQEFIRHCLCYLLDIKSLKIANTSKPTRRLPGHASDYWDLDKLNQEKQAYKEFYAWLNETPEEDLSPRQKRMRKAKERAEKKRDSNENQ